MYIQQPKDQEVHAQEQGLRWLGRTEGQRQRHAARGKEGRLRAGQDTLQVRLEFLFSFKFQVADETCQGLQFSKQNLAQFHHM